MSPLCNRALAATFCSCGGLVSRICYLRCVPFMQEALVIWRRSWALYFAEKRRATSAFLDTDKENKEEVKGSGMRCLHSPLQR